MPITYEGFADEYLKEVEESWERAKISVMVLGPSITATSVGANLRRSILEKCDLDHGIAIKGEHTRLRKVYERIVGHGGNLATYELGLAKKVDALIVIPDSPGSLVELGMFALEATIAQKTLILIQGKYERTEEPSFIQLGANLAYKTWGAHIGYVDFEDTSRIWEIVDEFLRRFRALKYTRLLRGEAV